MVPVALVRKLSFQVVNHSSMILVVRVGRRRVGAM